MISAYDEYSATFIIIGLMYTVHEKSIGASFDMFCNRKFEVLRHILYVLYF